MVLFGEGLAHGENELFPSIFVFLRWFSIVVFDLILSSLRCYIKL